jgi:protein dithiol oxidoreductase (disulfide-forming)
MKSIRRALIVLLALAPLGAFSQPRPNFVVLNPAQPTETDGKIEVIEFFRYDCIHCYEFEALLETWEKKLRSDVQFRRIPAVFNRRNAHDAAIFYTFEAMGVLQKTHRPLFEAIHRSRLDTTNEQALSEWLQKQGIDSKKFLDTLKSFAVQSKTRRATQLTIAYSVEGTPEMAVQGRYSVKRGATPEALQTVDYLIDQVRKQK